MFLLILSSHAFSNQGQLLVEKSTDTASSNRPETFSCKIYSDRVEIVRSLGYENIVFSQTQAINVAGNIFETLNDAKREQYKIDQTICQSGKMSIVAYSGAGPDAAFKLAEKINCDHAGQREGFNSKVLLRFVTRVCGE